MKNTCLFSIVVPIYNTKLTFLKECLESLLNQTCNNYEIILIDDGSNKETKDFLEQYKDEKIKLYHQENQGIVKSRINGINKANGKYILHVDSDDFISNDSIEILNSIVSDFDYDMVLFKSYPCLNDRTNPLDFIRFFKDGPTTKEFVMEQLLSLHINSITDKCAKKSLYLDMINHIDSSIINGEDLQQSTYLILNSDSFYYTDKPIEYYRINEENRQYYDVKKLHEVNFLIPTYNMVFVDNQKYSSLLPTYNTAAKKAIIYIAFQLCWLDICRKERNNLLDELNKQEIIHIINQIKGNTNKSVELIYFLLTHKLYFALTVCSIIFKNKN